MGFFTGITQFFAGSTVRYAPVDMTGAFLNVEAEQVAAVFTCTKILADNLSRMPINVVDENANNKKLADHRLSTVLRYAPNNYQNPQSFWSTIEYNRDLYGNAYALIHRNKANGAVQSLEIIPSNAVISAKVMNGALYYQIDFKLCTLNSRSDTAWMRSDEVLHFKTVSKDGIFGISPLTPLANYVQILGKAAQMVDNFYANNATSALAIETTLPNNAVAQKTKDATEDFIEKYAGPQNAGKPIKLPPNTKIVPIHQKFADAQLVETQAFIRDQIGHLYGIPSYMLKDTGSNESIEQQTRQFLSFTMSPIVEMYINELEVKLLTTNERKRGLKLEFDTEKLIALDIKTVVETTSMQVSKGLMTPAEASKKLGNAEIEGPYGKLHYIQSQNNPIELYPLWGNNDMGKAALIKKVEDPESLKEQNTTPTTTKTDEQNPETKS